MLKMEYGWNLWLKVSFITCTYIKKNYWNPSMRKICHSYYWICNFGKNPPFYELKNIFVKRFCACRDFKNIFARPRPKILIFLYIFHFEYVNEAWTSGVHKLCRLKGEGGLKLPILLSKKTTKRGEEVKNHRFWDDVVYGWPLSHLVLLVGYWSRSMGRMAVSFNGRYISRGRPRWVE